MIRILLLVLLQSLQVVSSSCYNCNLCYSQICYQCQLHNSDYGESCACGVSNCMTCNVNQINKCNTCSDGYTLDSTGKFCQQNSSNSSNYTTSIILGVTALVLCVGGGVGCCVCMACRKRLAQSFQVQDPNVSNVEFITPVEHLEFINDNQISFDKQKDNCSICLEQNTDTVTSCRHYFHLGCILKWFNDHPKKTCPNCVTEKVMVKYLCNKCRKFSINVEYCKCPKLNHQFCMPTYSKCNNCYLIK